MFKYKLYMHNLHYNYICIISNLILRNIYWLSKTIFILNKEIAVENGKIMSRILKLKYYFFLLLWQDKGSEKFTSTQSHTVLELKLEVLLLCYHTTLLIRNKKIGLFCTESQFWVNECVGTLTLLLEITKLCNISVFCSVFCFIFSPKSVQWYLEKLNNFI